jgi:hypothetical protein
VSVFLERGFVFWGLFVVSGATILGYWLWMRSVDEGE